MNDPYKKSLEQKEEIDYYSKLGYEAPLYKKNLSEHFDSSQFDSKPLWDLESYRENLRKILVRLKSDPRPNPEFVDRMLERYKGISALIAERRLSNSKEENLADAIASRKRKIDAILDEEEENTQPVSLSGSIDSSTKAITLSSCLTTKETLPMKKKLTLEKKLVAPLRNSNDLL